MRTKDLTTAYLLLYFISFYLVYAAAMLVAAGNYQSQKKADITLRVRRGGLRLARRNTTTKRLKFINQ